MNLVHLLVVVGLVLVLARAVVLQIVIALSVCAHTLIIRVFRAAQGFLIFSSFRSFSSNLGSFQVRRSVQIC